MGRDIRIQIDDELCQACCPCLAAEVCKVRAFVMIDPGETPYLDVSRCYDCRLCVQACPFSAISVRNGRNFSQG